MDWEDRKKKIDHLLGKPAKSKAAEKPPSLDDQLGAMDKQIGNKMEELEEAQKNAKAATKPEEVKRLEAEVDTLKQQLRNAVEFREQFERQVKAAKDGASAADDDDQGI